jgi:hypothetical protein
MEEICGLKERMESRRMEDESSRVVVSAERSLFEAQITNLSEKNSENE